MSSNDAANPAAASGEAGGVNAELETSLKDIQQVRRYAKYLYANIPLREAVQVSKRVNYFRGKKLYEILLETPITDKNCLPIKNEREANMVGVALLQKGLIHASEVADKKKRELRPVNTSEFGPEGYYTWIYEGSKTMRNMLLGLLVFSIAAMCMYPVWPQQAKVGIWYVSVTLLLFIFVLLFVRLILYLLFWAIGFEFWILPNFFDEDLGVMDSFRPLVSFERGGDLKETWFFRAAGLVMFVAFGIWCAQQPTDFDELYDAQMNFLAELYDGKLLQDPSKEEALRERAIPDVDELKKQIEREALGLDDEEGEDLDDDEEDSNLDDIVNAEAEETSDDENDEDDEQDAEEEEELDI
eukprot:CAMPEP_0184549668 /NCGR_PEP_ID=MMETSP0199_2-20130426/11572_1 /TAXON_ID=1112570 /ORGANISM="Thraustochytrium sp., Strain LLF1b" /LENGTH=355 /DNA_ID=CAMNT_0026944411 /DNA_START=183 /DNA_END=1250 /DNA_ORIENTATION=+